MSDSSMSEEEDGSSDKSFYICDICGQENLTFDDMPAHILSAHSDRPTCLFCNFIGENADEMTRHINTIHSEKSNITQAECLLNMNNNNSDMCICPLCDFVAENDVEIGAHMLVDHADFMDEDSSSDMNVDAKFLDLTTPENVPTCPICGYKNSNMVTLEFHINEHFQTIESSNDEQISRQKTPQPGSVKAFPKETLDTHHSVKSPDFPEQYNVELLAAQHVEMVELETEMLMPAIQQTQLVERNESKLPDGHAAKSIEPYEREEVPVHNSHEKRNREELVRQLAQMSDKRQREVVLYQQAAQLADRRQREVLASQQAQLAERRCREEAKRQRLSQNNENVSKSSSVSSVLGDYRHSDESWEQIDFSSKPNGNRSLNKSNGSAMSVDVALKNSRGSLLSESTHGNQNRGQSQSRSLTSCLEITKVSTGIPSLHIDNLKSCTKGVIGRVKQFHDMNRQRGDVRQSWLCAECDHFSTAFSDRGFGCGYRNLQMLMSSLTKIHPYPDVLFGGNPVIPSICKLQLLIEDAWRKGFDPEGSLQFHKKVYDTRKWIGATEIVTVFSSLHVSCKLVDFHSYTGPENTHPRLFDWVKEYFSSGANKPPLFLQHQGHSRTIIGMEELHDGSTRLLILDPGTHPKRMTELLKKPNPIDLMKSIRKTINVFKYEQYQIVAVDGVIPNVEAYEKSKILISQRIP